MRSLAAGGRGSPRLPTGAAATPIHNRRCANFPIPTRNRRRRCRRRAGRPLLRAACSALGIVLFAVLVSSARTARGLGQPAHDRLGISPRPGPGRRLLHLQQHRLALRVPAAAARTYGSRQLVAARLAGEAINNLTPTATIGGEVVRGRMLEGVVDSSAAWASIAIAKLMQTLAQMTFVFIGLVVVVRHTPLPEGVRARPADRPGRSDQRPAHRHHHAAARHVHRRVPAWRPPASAIPSPSGSSSRSTRLDEQIARFYAAPGAFAVSVLGFFAGWCMGVVEVYIVLYFLEVGASLGRADYDRGAVGGDRRAALLRARQAGTQEGGKVLIFSRCSVSIRPKGLALGIIRRAARVELVDGRPRSCSRAITPARRTVAR